MNLRELDDRELVRRLRTSAQADRALVDEYYRRCIPLYQGFLGEHWHTGYYGESQPSAADQVRMIEVVAGSIGLGPADRVLDVGCGIGGTVCHLAQHAGAQVTGLTPVAEQRTLAEALIRKRGLSERAEIVTGEAARLPFPDASFDAVVFFESPCHFPDRLRFFREVGRVLRPGGRLAGEDWLVAPDVSAADRDLYIQPIEQGWAIPALGDGATYVQAMHEAQFCDIQWQDLAAVIPLGKGFATQRAQQIALVQDIRKCREPLLQFVLEGLLHLGRAAGAGAFTIGQFSARKPTRQAPLSGSATAWCRSTPAHD